MDYIVILPNGQKICDVRKVNAPDNEFGVWEFFTDKGRIMATGSVVVFEKRAYEPHGLTEEDYLGIKCK